MNLTNGIRSEILKTWNTYISWLAIVSGIVIPALTVMIYMNTAHQGMQQTVMEVPWQTTALGEISTMIALILPASVILITAIVLYVEIRNNTWKHVLSTPRTLFNIHLSKFITVQYNVLKIFFIIYLLVGAFVVLHNYLGIQIFNLYQSPKSQIFFPLIGWLYISIQPVTIIQYILSYLFRNVIFPISIGLILTVGSVIMGNNINAAWFPYAYPRELILNTFDLSRRENNIEVKPDLQYKPQVRRQFNPERQPVISFDQAHNNRHLFLDKENKPGSYYGFGQLAEALGCKMQILTENVDSSILNQTDLLVIACPVAENNEPYTMGEINTIRSWVREGGALLLITDHIPFSQSAVSLARAFDIQFTIGTVVDYAQADKTIYEPGRIIYSTGKYSHESAILNNTNSIITYAGQGLKKINGTSDTLLRFSPYAYYEDDAGQDFNAKGYSQLIAFQFGKGKVAVTGEAAFLTAQIKGDELIGLNNRRYENELLCSNLLNWLLR